MGKCPGILQIRLGKHEDRFNLLAFRQSDHFVEHQRIGGRVFHRDDQKQLIDVCNRRAHQGIAARQDLFNIPVFSFDTHPYTVPHQRLFARLAEPAARAAFYKRSFIGLYGIKATQTAQNRPGQTYHYGSAPSLDVAGSGSAGSEEVDGVSGCDESGSLSGCDCGGCEGVCWST